MRTSSMLPRSGPPPPKLLPISVVHLFAGTACNLPSGASSSALRTYDDPVTLAASAVWLT